MSTRVASSDLACLKVRSHGTRIFHMHLYKRPGRNTTHSLSVHLLSLEHTANLKPVPSVLQTIGRVDNGFLH
jgi:hypothetical protein